MEEEDGQIPMPLFIGLMVLILGSFLVLGMAVVIAFCCCEHRFCIETPPTHISPAVTHHQKAILVVQPDDETLAVAVK